MVTDAVSICTSGATLGVTLGGVSALPATVGAHPPINPIRRASPANRIGPGYCGRKLAWLYRLSALEWGSSTGAPLRQFVFESAYLRYCRCCPCAIL